LFSFAAGAASKAAPRGRKHALTATRRGLQHRLNTGHQPNRCRRVGTAGGGDNHDRIALMQIGHVNLRRALQDASKPASTSTPLRAGASLPNLSATAGARTARGTRTAATGSAACAGRS
jgi:hypothetical protein